MTLKDDGSRISGYDRPDTHYEPSRYKVSGPRRRRGGGEPPRWQHKVVIALAPISGSMGTVAAFQLFGANGPLDAFKCVLLGVGMMLVAMAINPVVIREGSVQAALGYASGWVSFTLMVFTGLALAAFTVTGLLLDPGEARRFAEHGDKIALVLAAQEAASQQREEQARAFDVHASRVDGRDTDEKKDGGTSGRKGTGIVAAVTGRHVADTLALKGLLAENADALAGKVEAARKTVGDYRNRLATGGGDLRGGLQDLDGRFRTELTAIESGSGASQLAAYISGLEIPVIIPGNPGAARQLTEARLTEAAKLKKGLKERGPSATLGAFPAKTGAPEVMSYLLTYAPVTAGVLLVDAILPALLFILRFGWIRARMDQDDDGGGDDQGGNDADPLAQASGGLAHAERVPGRFRLANTTTEHRGG